ncbi:hypothetical protein INR49_020511 [Caranx melampygus]|nr:hypothetical protein INR49_020511 [Caranx melampygus]
MPLFPVWGRVHGAELLTNPSFTHVFPCASTFFLKIWNGLTLSSLSGTSVHFDPEDILCLLSSWERECSKTHIRQKSFSASCTVIEIKGRFKVLKQSR